jgi:hypothetical protein
MPHRAPNPRKKWEIVRKIVSLPEEDPLREGFEIEYTVRVHRNGYEKVLSRRYVPRTISPSGTG